MPIDVLNHGIIGDLYSETVNPGRPVKISEGLAKSILEDVGRNTGVMPVDNGLGIDPIEVPNEPVYVGPGSDALKRYAGPAIEKIKEYYRKVEDAVPYLGDIVVTAEKLPSKIGIFFKKVGNRYIITKRVLGKIFGMYRPGSKVISVDPVTFDSNDYEARHMAMKPENVGGVITHELTHAIQEDAGTLEIHDRSDVEAEATLRTSAITGNPPNAYPGERKRYMQKFGDSWITNLGRYAKKVKSVYIDPILESLGPQPQLAPVRSSAYRGR